MAITNEQSRETGNIGHKRRRKTKPKAQHNTRWTPSSASKYKTNNETRHESPTNNWRQSRTEHRFHVEIVTDITTWNLERQSTQ